MSKDFYSCLSRVFDNNRPNKILYHYYDDNKTLWVRPGIPLRYDMNDVSIVPIVDAGKTLQERTGHRHSELRRNGYEVSEIQRTWHNTLHSVLLYTIAIYLLMVSFLNLRKVVQAFRKQDPGLPQALFRVVFGLSFAVVLVLMVYLSVSLFEMFCNHYPMFPLVMVHNRTYHKIDLPDGRFQKIVLVFGFVSLLLALFENINQVAVEGSILLVVNFLFLVLAIFLFFRLFEFYTVSAPT